MIEDKERFITVEQRGIKNESAIVEYSQRTKSNTHRIDRLEDEVKELQKETSNIGELKTILRVQTEVSVNQAKQMEKLDAVLTSTNQNLTELNFITKHLQEKQNVLEEEAKQGRFTSSGVVKTIIMGIVAIPAALFLAWLSKQLGLK